jgi:hypothetical protein
MDRDDIMELLRKPRSTTLLEIILLSGVVFLLGVLVP